VEVEVLEPPRSDDACSVLVSLENDCARMSPLDAHKVGLMLLEAARAAGLYGEASVGTRWASRKTGRVVEVTAVASDPARSLTFKTVGKLTFERRSTRTFLQQFEQVKEEK
jgi:hypothetical protein